MKLPEFSVSKRVTTSMIAMIMVVVGFISFSRLGLDYFPDLEFPTISVITNYRGASSEDLEKTITRPLEQVVSSVSRVKKVTSITSEGNSVINAEFEWGTNLDFAAQDARDRIAQYRSFLPEEATDPLVVKFNLAQLPIIFLGVTSNLPSFEIKQILEDEVTPRLERIDGVASARVFAMDVREILVDVDKTALESRSLSLDRVIAALAAENVNLPAGYLVERHADFLVRTMGEFRSLDDLKRVVVGATALGEPIVLEDIAEVKDTLKEVRYTGRTQGQNGAFLMISKRSGANTATTGAQVKKEIEALKPGLPPGFSFHVAMDQSDMVQKVARRTVDNAWQGALLAILLIFLFLRNWRPTLTIALSIPLSIIVTFISFYAAGYTLNLLTLGGLTLGVGMLVDNAIVVIENTFRHVEEGDDRKKASIFGASEVGMAITASTLTTIVVFLPMVFAQGITGRLTRSLALSISFSLVSSLFVALTIVPLLSYLLLKAGRKKGGAETVAAAKGQPQFQKGRDIYRRWLTWTLHHRKAVLLGVVAAFIVSLALIPILGTEFMASQDQNMILLKVKLPVGTALEETDRVVAMVEKIMADQPEITMIQAQAGSTAEENAQGGGSMISPAGPHEGLLWVGLADQDKRDFSDKEILDRIRGKLPKLENVKFEAVDIGQMIMSGSGAPVEIDIFGQDLDKLREIGDTIAARIQDVPGLRDVTHTLAQGKPEYQIRIDRDRAAKLGLMTGQVAGAVQTATLGRVATRYREENEEIDVRVRFKKDFRDTIQEVETVPIVTPRGQVVYLGQIATVEKGEGPIQIARENQNRIVRVTGNIVGRDLGSVIKDVRARLGGIEGQLPAGYFLEYGGSFEDMQEAFKTIAAAFALAVLLVYMVMASQFESFRHPLIIMFTIPLGIIGVIAGLLIAGRPLNLPSLIGVVLLAGIAVNNGIVMIDYINQLRRGGLEGHLAVIDGAVTRLRAVLLTALTTILGMLPMAFSTSEGSEFRAPMAIAVLGGLTATTFLTLFVIPVIYSLFEKINFKKAKEA